MRATALAGLVPALLWVAGCRAGPEIKVRYPHGFALMGKGKTAVLKVSARAPSEPKSYQFVWGIVDVPNAQSQFAELVAYFAREEGGLEVIPPEEVNRRLRAAGLEPTLDPDPQQLQAFVEALDCASYIVAEVETWRMIYKFTSQKALARFSLTAYLRGFDWPLWRAKVRHVDRLKSEREVAIEALQQTFRTLRKPERKRRNADTGH